VPAWSKLDGSWWPSGRVESAARARQAEGGGRDLRCLEGRVECRQNVVVGGHFVVSFALPVWFGGLSFDRRDGLAALVFWLLGLACWAALHFASPRPNKPSSRGRSHQPKPAN
jgi:hypothetical protein